MSDHEVPEGRYASVFLSALLRPKQGNVRLTLVATELENELGTLGPIHHKESLAWILSPENAKTVLLDVIEQAMDAYRRIEQGEKHDQ